MGERWNGDPSNPTIQEIMDDINPGYFKLNFANGTPRTLLKNLDKKAIVFWKEKFSAVFAIRNGSKKLNFFSAVNTSPLGSMHLPIVSKRQITAIISMRPDIALSFLEDINGEDYSVLHAESCEEFGKYLGSVHITRSKPLIKSTGFYPDNVYEFVGRETENMMSLHVYDRNGELVVRTSAWGEVGTHARKPISDHKHRSNCAWAEHDLIVGTRQIPLGRENPGIPAEEHHYLWETTTTLSDEVHKKLIGVQTMENL